MDCPNPPGRNSTLGTPNLLCTKDTPCSLCPQDQGHPKNLPLQPPEATRALQAPSIAPCLLSDLY